MAEALSAGERSSGISSSLEGISRPVGVLSLPKSCKSSSLIGDKDLSSSWRVDEDLLLKMLLPVGDSWFPTNLDLFSSSG